MPEPTTENHAVLSSDAITELMHWCDSKAIEQARADLLAQVAAYDSLLATFDQGSDKVRVTEARERCAARGEGHGGSFDLGYETALGMIREARHHLIVNSSELNRPCIRWPLF